MLWLWLWCVVTNVAVRLCSNLAALPRKVRPRNWRLRSNGIRWASASSMDVLVHLSAPVMILMPSYWILLSVWRFLTLAELNPKYMYCPPKLNIKFTMHTAYKNQLTPFEVKSSYLSMLSNYVGHTIPVFTDGSVKEEKSGCAIAIKRLVHTYRLPNNTTIFTAELFAILKAIE
ncbi:unnamed protein product, partial [Meganyctiphanes norvegica]